ncbi:MAG: dienelactone hydrolase family protein [Pelolinea sp.]|nr:dienelactone hydrolase family protein [Pelolinea sp.]
MVNKKVIFWVLILMMGISACSPPPPSSVSDEDAAGDTDALTVQITPIVSPTSQPSLFSLESLAKRTYGKGEFNVEYTWERQADFVRYKVNYTSDGLTMHGFVNIPVGEGPFPVVIALHGYIPANEYETLDYSSRYADSIARKGYIVLHPNMRNFPPSDSVPRTRDYLSGYTVDVMNMLAYVRDLAGQPGIFENADLSRMGIWGHSLGGGTALRVVGLVDEIQAAAIYAGVSQRYTNASTGFEIFDYAGTNAAFSVHHGTEDDTISINWSRLLCKQLEDAGKQVECYYYDSQPHTFYRQGEGDASFIKRTIELFDSQIKDS